MKTISVATTSALMLLSSYAELRSQPPIIPAASVFRVIVEPKDTNSAAMEGTAFVIEAEGDPNNPILYLLTAAHVVLGPDAKDDTAVSDVVKKISVRFSAAEGDLWVIDPNSVRIAPQWKSSGRDFALFKVISAGRKVTPLPLASQLPDENIEFKAYAYPPEFSSAVAITGRTVGPPGASSSYLWILADATLTPAMSGGPALYGGEVFATVEGAPINVPQLKFLAPLTLIRSFLLDYVPNLSSTIAEPRFEAHAYVVRKKRVATTQEMFERRSESVNVGCESSASSEVVYPLPPDASAAVKSVQWINTDNIKSMSASSAIGVGYVRGSGTIVGLDKQLFNCPGGGHGTLEISGSLTRRVTTTDNTAVDIGTSEVAGEPISFSVPADDDVRVETLRVDLRPLNSGQNFGSITVELGDTDQQTQVEQTIFGTRFKVSANTHILAITSVKTARSH